MDREMERNKESEREGKTARTGMEGDEKGWIDRRVETMQSGRQRKRVSKTLMEIEKEIV